MYLHKNCLFWIWGIGIDLIWIFIRLFKTMNNYIEIHATIISILGFLTLVLEILVIYNNFSNILKLNNDFILIHFYLGLLFAVLLLV